jgi:hypothetical protein
VKAPTVLEAAIVCGSDAEASAWAKGRGLAVSAWRWVRSVTDLQDMDGSTPLVWLPSAWSLSGAAGLADEFSRRVIAIERQRAAATLRKRITDLAPGTVNP